MLRLSSFFLCFSLRPNQVFVSTLCSSTRLQDNSGQPKRYDSRCQGVFTLFNWLSIRLSPSSFVRIVRWLSCPYLWVAVRSLYTKGLIHLDFLWEYSNMDCLRSMSWYRWCPSRLSLSCTFLRISSSDVTKHHADASICLATYPDTVRLFANEI